MANVGTVSVRIVIDGGVAVDELQEALDILDDAAADMPWRPDIAEAAALIRSAGQSLVVEEQNDE